MIHAPRAVRGASGRASSWARDGVRGVGAVGEAMAIMRPHRDAVVVQPTQYCTETTLREGILCKDVAMRLPAFRSCMDELARETGYAIFTRAMLAHTVLRGETRRAMQRTIASAIADGLLVRQCRGVYRYRYAAVGRRDLAQEVVLRCRPREVSYVSLESALVRFGAIEQAMLGGVTVMTTGRSQCLDTVPVSSRDEIFANFGGKPSIRVRAAFM